jgi:glycosyltransferase involved in cell wall biosynthesis
MKKVVTIGSFGFGVGNPSGQRVKSQNVYQLLKETGNSISFVEMIGIWKKPWALIRMIKEIWNSDVAFCMPAQRNLITVFPFLCKMAKFRNIPVHYVVVGGWLADFIENRKKLQKILSSIAGIHCQTQELSDTLREKYGFTNTDVFPNFRLTGFRSTPHHTPGVLKLVFMARINKLKGLDNIFFIGDLIKQARLDNIFIDFYGPIYDEDKSYFEQNLKKYDFMRYVKSLDPSEIYPTLEQYDAMLLPTHYYTEGFPGSVLDAYISGIPVIVTKWKYATEFVGQEQSGLIVPFDDNGTEMFKEICRIKEDEDFLNQLKQGASIKWKEYSPDVALEKLEMYLNN